MSSKRRSTRKRSRSSCDISKSPSISSNSIQPTPKRRRTTGDNNSQILRRSVRLQEKKNKTIENNINNINNINNNNNNNNNNIRLTPNNNANSRGHQTPVRRSSRLAKKNTRTNNKNNSNNKKPNNISMNEIDDFEESDTMTSGSDDNNSSNNNDSDYRPDEGELDNNDPEPKSSRSSFISSISPRRRKCDQKINKKIPKKKQKSKNISNKRKSKNKKSKNGKNRTKNTTKNKTRKRKIKTKKNKNKNKNKNKKNKRYNNNSSDDLSDSDDSSSSNSSSESSGSDIQEIQMENKKSKIKTSKVVSLSPKNDTITKKFNKNNLNNIRQKANKNCNNKNELKKDEILKLQKKFEARDDGWRRIYECHICTELLCIPVTLECGHNFCHDCLKEYFTDVNESGRSTKCPHCRAEIKGLSKEKSEWRINTTVQDAINYFLKTKPPNVRNEYDKRVQEYKDYKLATKLAKEYRKEQHERSQQSDGRHYCPVHGYDNCPRNDDNEYEINSNNSNNNNNSSNNNSSSSSSSSSSNNNSTTTTNNNNNIINSLRYNFDSDESEDDSHLLLSSSSSPDVGYRNRFNRRRSYQNNNLNNINNLSNISNISHSHETIVIDSDNDSIRGYDS